MSLPTHPLDSIPLWGIFLLTFGLLLLASEVGFQAGKSWQHRVPDKDTAIGAMVGALLGLVAFLLAFLTSMAADRFDTRRGLVLAEANALGTAYLQAGYLPEPIDSESRDLIREYVDVRISAAEPGSLESAISRAEAIQVELWAKGEDLVVATGGSDVYALYLDSLNEVIELHGQREIAAFYARLPTALILAIFGFALLVLFILGFGNSYDGRRSAIALVSLVFVFSAVLYLIMDLDRSREGLFQVSDQALISLQERLHP